MFKQHDLAGLLRIFDFERKQDLEQHCRTLTIHADDFANLVIACRVGNLPYKHAIHYRDIVPQHLWPTDEEFEAIKKSEVGKLSGRGLKFSSKVAQIFKDRRYLVGHMFSTIDLEFWHFFYFDQRDMDERENHWVGGSHIHLVNDLWPNLEASAVMESFATGNPRISGSLHVRFQN